MAQLSKAEYLKRYMSAEADTTSNKPKKKRLKKLIKSATTKETAGFKIVDEDVDLNQIDSINGEVDDEQPTIAEVIDERPEQVKHMEVYSSSDKWKKIGGSGAHDSEKYHSDNSPPRKKRHASSDSSPPRRKRNHSDSSPPRRKRNDSDNSPPRRKRNDSDSSPPRRKRNDSDSSPPRRKRNDSDSSPPRRKRNDSDSSPPRRRVENTTDGVAAKTLSGKLAGLSSAKDMKKEAQKLKIKEIEMFNKIGDDKLGRNAEAVFRDKSGKRRDLNAEKEATDAKAAEWKSKYDSWGKGVAQGAAEQERMADMVHEMNKPLARSRDDADLDAHLKQLDREGDPMLKYMKQKKESKKKGPKYPQYKGPAPEPNRFGIRPGYRWDGVDRANGFEKKYFQSISKRKAVSADAYKWSTEDM